MPYSFLHWVLTYIVYSFLLTHLFLVSHFPCKSIVHLFRLFYLWASSSHLYIILFIDLLSWADRSSYFYFLTFPMSLFWSLLYIDQFPLAATLLFSVADDLHLNSLSPSLVIWVENFSYLPRKMYLKLAPYLHWNILNIQHNVEFTQPYPLLIYRICSVQLIFIFTSFPYLFLFQLF